MLGIRCWLWYVGFSWNCGFCVISWGLVRCVSWGFCVVSVGRDWIGRRRLGLGCRWWWFVCCICLWWGIGVVVLLGWRNFCCVVCWWKFWCRDWFSVICCGVVLVVGCRRFVWFCCCLFWFRWRLFFVLVWCFWYGVLVCLVVVCFWGVFVLLVC